MQLPEFRIKSTLFSWIKNPDDPILEQTVMYEFGTDACNIESSLNETHFTFDGMLNGESGAANDVISRINKVELPFRACSLILLRIISYSHLLTKP